MRYFIGITGITTAGKSTLGLSLLSPHITPHIFPIPHTTYREARLDDDARLIRILKKNEYDSSDFLTIDGNYGTLNSDYKSFLTSEHQIALSIVSCYEIPELKEKLSLDRVVPIFISLTLSDSLLEEEKLIEDRLPVFFNSEELRWRINLNKQLAKDFFFNKTYLEEHSIVSLSLNMGHVITWIDKLKEFLPISYSEILKEDLMNIQRDQNSRRNLTVLDIK